MILLGTILAYVGYMGMWYRTNIKIGVLIIVYICSRLLVLTTMPLLSNDFIRFNWDGVLLTNGINPYTHIPMDIDLSSVYGLDTNMLYQMNSASYYSVYPPLMQILFYIAAVFSKGTPFVVVLRGLYCTIEMVIGGILYYTSGKNKRTISLFMLYALCPLALIEGIGQLHPEGVMVPCLLLALYSYNNNVIIFMISYLASVAAKLLPLIAMPFIFFQGFQQKLFRFVFILLTLCIMSLSPLWLAIYDGYTVESFQLYFQKFEFNASIYYILRHMGFELIGYNAIHFIGPLMSMIVGLWAFYKAYTFRKLEGNQVIWIYCISVWMAYLLLNTTVHPWYILPVVGLGIMQRFWVVIPISMLVFLSYSHYINNTFTEKYYIIFLEYILVGLCLLHYNKCNNWMTNNFFLSISDTKKYF